MEKESGLWDDSEILKAFDNAVKKYKEMNKQNHHNNSIMRRTMETNLEKLTRSTDEEDEVTGSVKVDDDNIVVLSIVKDAAEATDLPSYQENCPADSSAPDPLMHASSSHIPEVIEGYTNTKGEVEYNQLLSQYYELQGQMQKVVQQLYQVGNEPCQFTCEGSGSGAQWGTCGSTQDHQDPITSHPVAVSSCFPCACYCSGYSYPSLPAFALCGASVGNPDAYHAATACTGGPAKLSSFNDDPAAKTAAERAIASVKQITSGTTNVHEGDEHLDSSRDKIAQSVGSGTELDVVLSAWYTAGFHTGRYLMEQSNTKKGQTNVHATGIHDQKSTSL